MNDVFYRIGGVFAIQSQGKIDIYEDSKRGMRLTFSQFFGFPRIADTLYHKLKDLGIDPLNFSPDSVGLLKAEKTLQDIKPAIIVKPYVMFVDAPYVVVVSNEAGRKDARIWCPSWENYFKVIPEIANVVQFMMDKHMELDSYQSSQFRMHKHLVR